MSNNREEERRERRRAQLKRAFEQERDEILASIPEEYKKMFGQIGFTKWSKALIPVVILNPYHLPGGPDGAVRNQWLAMYEKLRAQNRLESMSYVVYFYGADDPGIYYGFVQQKLFTPYEREKSKGTKSVHKLPEKIKKKIDSGAPLSTKDKSTQRGYDEMEEDLLKSPEDRIRGITEFLEEYELRAEEELDQESNASSEGADTFHLDEKQDEKDDGDDEKEPTAAAPTKTKKSKKKKTNKVNKSSSKAKPKKHKQARQTDDQELVVGDETDDPFGERQAEKAVVAEPKKKKKQLPPEAQQEDDELELDIGEAEEPPPPPEEPVQKKKKPGRPKKSAKAQREEENSELDIGEAEEPPLPAEEPVPKKKKRGRPKKSAEVQHEELEIGEADVPLPPPEEPVPKQKKRGRPKMSAEEKAASKKSKKLDAIQEQELAMEEQDAKEEVAEPAAQEIAEDVKLPSVAQPPAPEMNVESDGIGDYDDEQDSDDDEKDPAFDEVLAGDAAAAAAQDEDFEEEELLLKKSSKKTKKAKEPVAKKASKAKHKEVRPQTDQRKKKVEKEALARCEKNHLDFVESWISAVQQRSGELVRGVLAEAEGVVEQFSATFIVCYGISALMKETKTILKEASAEADLKTLNSLREKLKVTHSTKAALVPKDYKPKLSRQDIADKANKLFGTKSASSAKSLDESQRSTADRNIADSKPAWKDNMKPIKKEGAPTQQKATTVAAAATAKNPPNFNRQLSNHIADGAAARAPPPRPKIKKFSLGDMLRSKDSKEALAAAGAPQDSKACAVAHEKMVKAEPSGPLPWWKNPVSNLEAPTEDPRALALEFLLQTTEHFDAGTVHGGSLALALEAAIYEWAQKNNRGIAWTSVYWDKVHALTAAICGKHDRGSLLNLIAQGSFASPDKIAALSEDQLNDSFEGRPLDM